MKKKTLIFPIFISTFMLAGVLASLFITPPSARADGFVVEVNFDDAVSHDDIPGDGICADATNLCTLRAAIEEANARLGTDTITFASAMTVTLDAGEGKLPDITDQLVIDASGVWDVDNNRPGIVLVGNSQINSGFTLQTDSNEIFGLYIRGFAISGIDVASSGNTIGGIGVGQRNILSGNDGSGISIGTNAANGNVIVNNFIGVAPDGTTKVPNTSGITVLDGASSNLVGGLTAVEGNLIAGNTEHGVIIGGANTDQNQLYNNTIGGSASLGNGKNGVFVHTNASNTIIGLYGLGGNTIAYNGEQGVYAATITGTTKIEANVIKENNQGGIASWGNGLQINNNTIHNNGGIGVAVVGASGNTIQQNKIYDNADIGIDLLQNANNNIAAPVITYIDLSGVAGTACPGCLVEVFSDNADEGRIIDGFGVANGDGNWVYIGNLTGPNVTTVATDSAGNSSEFSLPKAVPFAVYLPVIIKE